MSAPAERALAAVAVAARRVRRILKKLVLAEAIVVAARRLRRAILATNGRSAATAGRDIEDLDR